MYAPMPPAQPAPAMVPVEVLSPGPAMLAPPARTTLSVWSSRLNVLDGTRASVTGALRESPHVGRSGRVVLLQELLRHGWRTVSRTYTTSGGRFRLSFTAHGLGSPRVRLRFAGDASARASRRVLGHLNVFRLAGASWYGGGGQLACGGSLSSSTLGVANKTLPCGTMVTLRYGGRSVRVPVIDRGPYVEGREFDLTEATKNALGFGDTGDVWSTS